MYQVLLFDADNTLFDFDACEQQALIAAFQQYHIDLTAPILSCFHAINADLWGKYERGELSREEVVYTRFQKLFSRFGIAADGVRFEHTYQSKLAQGHQLMEGAEVLLRALKPRYRLFLVSNGVVPTQIQRLHDSGLYPLFERIFLSEEIGSRKPQPAFFEPVLQAAAPASRKELLLIGDSLSSDIAGANAIGIDCVWMNPKRLPTVKDLHINYEIRRLEELYAILELPKNAG